MHILCFFPALHHCDANNIVFKQWQANNVESAINASTLNDFMVEVVHGAIELLVIRHASSELDIEIDRANAKAKAKKGKEE